MVKSTATESSKVPATSKRAGTQLRAVAWTPGAGMPYPEWVASGRRLGAMARASNWWVGDWVRYGTRRWGEKYVAASRMTGYDVHTLRNMAYVSSRFDLSLRRDDLTWSHHALLASLEPEERVRWLERAADDRLSVADLRTELRAATRGALGAAAETAEASTTPAGERAAVCPHCGMPLAQAKPDWNAFVGDLVRRRYGRGAIGRRRAA